MGCRNILHVIPYFRPAMAFGGPATISDLMVSELSQRCRKVAVWTSDIGGIDGSRTQGESEIRPNVTIVRYRYLSRTLYELTGIIITPGMHLDSLLKEYVPDLVHLHDFRSHQAICAYSLAKRKSLPLVLQPHGSLKIALGKERAKRAYDRVVGGRILKYASRIVALTDTEVQDCIAAGVPPSRIAVIPNGVPLPGLEMRDDQGQFRREHGISEDSLLILFLGRLRVSKGVHVLLEAFGKLVTEYPDAVLALCGPDDGAASSLASSANQQRLRVVMTGMLGEAQKRRAMTDSDIFCLPSLFETQSVALLEAASYGLPIVAGRRNVPKEFLLEKAGLFVEVTPTALAEALLTLAQSPNLRRELGNRSRLVVEASFSAKMLVSRILELYREIEESRTQGD